MWTSNSGEAVSGLSGLSGTILVSCLILLVIGLIAGVLAAFFHKKAQQAGPTAGALAQVGRVTFGAAVIASAGALFMGGASLYTVPKVEAQKAPPAESKSECSESRTATINAGVWEDEFNEKVDIPEFDQPLASAEAEYWPDPSDNCSDNTVDSCRMVHLTGTTGDAASMTGFEKVDEWIPPKGECEGGEPEEVEFS